MINEKYKIISSIIMILLFLLLIFKVLPDTYDSPGPNQEYVDEVVEWSGREPCCDMIWYEMCDAYKKNKSVEFECFT